MKRVLRFVLPTIAVAAFGVLWLATRDPIVALLSFIVLVLGLALLLAVGFYLFANLPFWWRRIRGVTHSEYLERLEHRGDAVREQYQTVRALSFEDRRTSCMVHLIDIGHQQVLCLYGQYYYDFEPIEDDPELNQTRQFPTTEFSLLRNKKSRDVLAVFPGSTVLDPVKCDPVVDRRRLDALNIKLSDGAVFERVSFPALEAALRQGA